MLKNNINIWTLILLFLFSGFISTNLLAANIGGIVRDSSSSEPLVGATVMLEGTKYGTRTNKSGFYSIPKVPAGKYTIIARFMGYQQVSKTIEIKKDNEDLRINLELEPTAIMTEAVQVTAEREIETREITISKVNVPVNQIKEIRVGGESDVFRTLQLLPGVLTSSQISSGLYVRGGSPDQNLILLDGATVYNPSHLFGFFSTFNTNAIKDVEFIKGGFDAEYGGRMSSVLNITQKDGNRKEMQGSLSIGVIASQATLEVPLFNGAVSVSARRTYLDLLMPALESFLAEGDDNIPNFYFYDVNFKLTQDIGDNDKFSISAFYSSDDMDFEGFSSAINMDLGNRLLSGHWTHIFSSNLFSTFVINYSKYKYNFNGGQTGYGFILNNYIEDMSAKANLEWFIGENTSLKFGAEVGKLNFDFLLNMTGDTSSTSFSSAGEINMFMPELTAAGFIQGKTNLTEYLSLQGGLRSEYYKLSNSFYMDPRIAIRYMLTGNISIKAAWGIYHQALRIAGFPNFSIVDTWLPTDTSVNVSKGIHYIFSTEFKPNDTWTMNFDLYYKTMEGIGEMRLDNMVISKVTDVLFIGDAKAYGGEIFIQKQMGKWTGWLGYTLGFIWARFDSINNGKEFHPKYDRTHDFKVVLQYSINPKWEVGGTFTLQSGQSYTGATSHTRVLLPDQSYGSGKIINSDLYGLRLPVSHQLNLYGAYNFKLWGQNARVVLDIYNVYNRRDILMRYYNTSDEVVVVEDMRLLPIIPSVSFEMSF